MVQKVQSIRSAVKLQRPTAGTREPGELYTNWADSQLGVITAAKTSQDLIAVRFFSTLTDYVAGDFVVNAGTGYRAKTSITAGAFNITQWDTLATSLNVEPPIAAGTTAQYWRGDKSWQTLNPTAVGLGNVDNTSDANKPVSSPTQAALNLKAPLASPTFTGTVVAPTPSAGTNNTTVATTAFVATSFAPVLDPFFAGNPQAPTPATADNDTSIATTAHVQANMALKANATHTHVESDITNLVTDLAAKAPLASPVFTGNPTAPTPTAGDNDTSIATTQFVATAISGIAPSGMIVQTVITISGTYTKPAGLRYLEVEVIAGGGAGGGAVATAAAQWSAGGGGGGGGYSKSLLSAAAIGTTEVMTIGAGGTGVSGLAGNSGGNSSFGALVTANGGGGSSVSGAGAAMVAWPGGQSAAVGTGDLAIAGSPGGTAVSVGNTATGGTGGQTPYGGGGRPSANATGAAGLNYGSGGSGNANIASIAAKTGANGASGVIILKEYF